jgi:hypothetical protein
MSCNRTSTLMAAWTARPRAGASADIGEDLAGGRRYA